MSDTNSVAIGKAHIAGYGNVFASGVLKVIRDSTGRFLVAVDSGLDAIAIEMSPEGAEALRHQLGAGTVVELERHAA
jgi:hypothetical protein